ncbi:MAG: general secretion pathway protein GspK [Aquificae bacterium]|nr:general secretion pathway protein GspK [Aquificota bacterium]
MIVALVLVLFLSLSYEAAGLLEEVTALNRTFTTVYRKEQAFLLTESLLPKALELLTQEDGSYDALTDAWARPFSYETPLGTLEVTVVDKERFLNPNLLGSSRAYDEAFERLLRLLGIDPILAYYIKVWIGKAEGSLPTDYPPKRKPMDSIYEIELFWPDREELYGSKDKPGLYEFISVFAGPKVNINTAPPLVLMALDERITPHLARAVARARSERPFKTLKELLRVEGVTLDLLYRLERLAGVKSENFRLVFKLEGFEERVYFNRPKRKLLLKEIY